MSRVPPEENGASLARIALWVAVAGVGLWMVGSGLLGILSR